MYCFVTKGSPCRATPYPFKCVGLHVSWNVNTNVNQVLTEEKKSNKQSKTHLLLMKQVCGKWGKLLDIREFYIYWFLKRKVTIDKTPPPPSPCVGFITTLFNWPHSKTSLWLWRPSRMFRTGSAVWTLLGCCESKLAFPEISADSLWFYSSCQWLIDCR